MKTKHNHKHRNKKKTKTTHRPNAEPAELYWSWANPVVPHSILDGKFVYAQIYTSSKSKYGGSLIPESSRIPDYYPRVQDYTDFPINKYLLDLYDRDWVSGTVSGNSYDDGLNNPSGTYDYRVLSVGYVEEDVATATKYFDVTLQWLGSISGIGSNVYVSLRTIPYCSKGTPTLVDGKWVCKL